jgi:hypothetical protein
VNDPGSFVDPVLIHDDRDLNLGRRDHLDIDRCMSQHLKHFSGDTGVGAHADANDAKFGDAADRLQTFGSDLGHYWVQTTLDLG